MPTVSLCSYTYNDARLLHGLLAHSASWTVQPDEIVLVDDGSDPPFALLDSETRLPLRLIRLPENRGFRNAKHTGLSAAQGDILLSTDCDARLSPDFLACALEHLADQDNGLVSGCSGLNLGEDMLSRYLNVFGDKMYVKTTQTVDFINGGAFALRREVWEKIDGFNGFGGVSGEDHYLCQTLKAKGYALLLDSRIHVAYARVMTRQAFCRRIWTWCGQAWLHAARQDLSLPEYFAAFFLQPMLERCAIIARAFPHEYLYLELLQIFALAFAFCNSLVRGGRVPAQAGMLLLRGLENSLRPYPALRGLLKADLIKSGMLPPVMEHDPDPHGTHDAHRSRLATVCDWESSLAFLKTLADTGMLSWLNNEGVPRVLADEAELKADFSTYMHT